MTCDRRVDHLILQSGRMRRHSLSEASYQLGIGLDADQVASRSHHRGYVGGGNTQAAAKLHDVGLPRRKLRIIRVSAPS